ADRQARLTIIMGRAACPLPPFRPQRALAMVSADAISGLFFGPLVDGAECVCVETGRLEGLDVRKPIDDAATDLQISRPAALPAPLLERAWRNQPALRQIL